MIRIVTFISIVSAIAFGGMAIAAGSQSSRAEAGQQNANCQIIIVEPNAAYGIDKKHSIKLCR